MQETLNLILSEIQGLRGDFNRLEQKVDKLEQKVDHLEQDVLNTRLLLENEISRKIDIIGEGHDFLKQRLDNALQMEKKRERMELDIVNLQIDVKMIKEHSEIA